MTFLQFENTLYCNDIILDFCLQEINREALNIVISFTMECFKLANKTLVLMDFLGS